VLEFDLARDLNIYFGVNGSGKTSLLKILYSALQNDVRHLRRVKFDEATVVLSHKPHGEPEEITRWISSKALESIPPASQLINFPGPSGVVQVPVGMPQQGWRSEPAFNDGFPATYLPISRFVIENNNQFQWNLQDPTPYSEANLDQQFVNQINQRWFGYQNVMLNQIRQLQAQGMASILTTLFTRRQDALDSEAPESAYASVQQFFLRQSMPFSVSREEFISSYADTQTARVVGEIDDVERRIEEIELPRIRLDELVSRFITTNKRVSFSGPMPVVLVGDQQIGLDALSSGEKQILRLLIDALSMQGECMLIDEPEISLNIDWQRELIEAIQTVNPNVQLIIATHAPEIMAKVADGNINKI